MFNEIKTFLLDVAPNQLDIVGAALKVLERIDFPNYQDEYINTLMLADTDDINGTLDKILNITLDLLNSVLKAHEIRLADDSNIETHTLFVNALIDIQDYGDIPTLLSIVNMNISPNETLAELVALVSHKNSSELLPEIEYVSPAFIGMVRDNCEEVPDIITDEELEVKQKYINLFNKFIRIINTDKLEIVKLINSGMDLGYTFDTYINVIGKYLEEMKPIDIAMELVGCALVSSDGCSNPIGIIQERIDNFVADMDKVTKVNIIVTDLLLKLQMA